MLVKLKTIFRFADLDRAVAFALAGRSWSLLSSLVTLVLVVRFLTPEEQGYYYSFSAVLGAQILFELGMGVVATQFASHCMASLAWSDRSTLEGDVSSKSRMRSLVQLMIRWYTIIGALIILVLGPIGWFFFSQANPYSNVHWEAAWAWLILAAAVNITSQPLLSLLEGCRCVEEVARIRFIQSVAASIAAWITLLLGGGLLALPAWNTALAVTAYLFLAKRRSAFFRDMLFRPTCSNQDITWRTEIWPFQWRIAVSWISGYFIFQLFVPVLFVSDGPIEAGKMGLSLAIANALLGLSLSWLNTKSPKFGELIANRDYFQLDNIFNRTLYFTLALLVVGGIMLCAINYMLQIYYMKLGSRLLPPYSFNILILSTILNYITIAQSSYLRAHKEEPFLFVSIASGFAIAISTFLMADKFGAQGLMLGYLACTAIIGLGWGTFIFINKRREYQSA